MGETTEHAGEPAGSSARRRGRWWVLAGAMPVVLVIGVVALLVVGHLVGGRERPSFPSLAATPDATLRGTVAYVDTSSCVRIVAMAGQPSKEVLCLPPLDPATAKTLGKPTGPQLVWLPDGRLEVTMFRMTDPPGPNFNPGWQKIVDVRTGAVTDVPAAQVPSSPNLTSRPDVNPSGERITFTSDAPSGHITIVLTDATGRSRTLVDVRGPGEYGYGLEAAFWSPDGRLILADDGRILVITPDDPPVVRTLIDQISYVDPKLARFAVTSENLLAATA